MIGMIALVGAVLGGLALYGTGVLGDAGTNPGEKVQSGMEMLIEQTGDMEGSMVTLATTPLETEPGEEVKGRGEPDERQGGEPGETAESSYSESIAGAEEQIAKLEAFAGSSVALDPLRNQVTGLKSRWDPKYGKATDDFKKFQYRLEKVKSLAADYFNAQFDLTDEIMNASLRSTRSEYYYRQISYYQQWERGADATLQQATALMNDLNDINIIITQQYMESSFTSLMFDEFAAIPKSLSSLHVNLSEFREATANLNVLFEEARE